jgi:hypothetical protein
MPQQVRAQLHARVVAFFCHCRLGLVNVGPQARLRFRSSGDWNNDCWCKMTRTELIIQLLKVAIGLAFGTYFVWWSLEVLDRLTP